MSYWDISQMAADSDLTQREQACAAQEPGIADPLTFVAQHGLKLAASPGWADAWASAVAGNVERPGKDPSVITDGQILSAIQAVAAG